MHFCDGFSLPVDPNFGEFEYNGPDGTLNYERH
jgi:hypothetical protein